MELCAVVGMGNSCVWRDPAAKKDGSLRPHCHVTVTLFPQVIASFSSSVDSDFRQLQHRLAACASEVGAGGGLGASGPARAE